MTELIGSHVRAVNVGERFKVARPAMPGVVPCVTIVTPAMRKAEADAAAKAARDAVAPAAPPAPVSGETPKAKPSKAPSPKAPASSPKAKPAPTTLPAPCSFAEYVDAVRARRLAPGEAAIRFAAATGKLSGSLENALAQWCAVGACVVVVPEAFLDAARASGGIRRVTKEGAYVPAEVFGWRPAV